MTMRLILINGPSQSGKTTISRSLVQVLNEKHAPCVSDSFSSPLKHFIASALAERYNEMNKEIPRAELSGYSVREVFIDMAQEYFKKRYGDDCFGRWLMHRALRYKPTPKFVVVDDLGFQEELDTTKDHFIVRVMRSGKNYKKDSRGYVGTPDFTVFNDRPIEELWMTVRQLANAITGTSSHG